MAYLARQITILALIGLLITPAVSSAQTNSDMWFIGLQPLYTGLAVLDASVTVQCVERSICHEANPALRPLVDRHGIKTAMGAKLGLQAGLQLTAIYAWHRYPQHRKSILLSFATMTALQGYVDYRNFQTLRRHP